jgi:hypothetical protein
LVEYRCCELKQSVGAAAQENPKNLHKKLKTTESEMHLLAATKNLIVSTRKIIK